MKKILVTGANGFLGKAISAGLIAQGYEVLCATRNSFVLAGAKNIRISSLENQAEWAESLVGVDCVIHTAARAHMMDNLTPESFEEFRLINVTGTLKLAQQASQCGVRRFIFISSIAVNGNHSSVPFSERDIPKPQSSYAISKHEAEQKLVALAKETSMEVVIIRPPLVYGHAAPGNFEKLIHWVNKGVPLPFGAISNKRSFIALDNLVSFVLLCVEHSKAANEIFLISDGEDLSTTALIQKTAKVFGIKPMLVPVPVSLMKAAAKLIGRQELAIRLFESLQVNSSKARELLGWKPVITMDGQLQKTADAYRNEKAF